MKCVDLIATRYVIMADCGGHVMQEGDVIMVDELVADRMCLQHKMTKGESHEVGKLQHGHWQVRKMTVEGGANVEKALKVKEAPKEEVKKADDIPAAEDFEPADKSMGTQSGEPKKKKKKKTSTKG